MKIAGCIIQNKNIEVYTNDEFRATYKGRGIYITTDHGHGKPEDRHLKRFDIDVIHLESGMYDVQTYQDCTNIRDAIIYALDGAMLINKEKPF